MVSTQSFFLEDLVVQGGLRADQLSRTLVPALLEKANKIQRQKVKRTGSSAVDPAGMQDEAWIGTVWYC